MSTTSKLSGRYPLVPENVLNAPPEFWERELFLDLHGVLLPGWLQAFLKFYNDAMSTDIDIKDGLLYFRQYSFEKGMRPGVWNDLFLEFANLVKGGYGDLEPDPVVLKALHKIAKAGINVKVCSWTPGANEISQSHDKHYGTGAAQKATLELLERIGAPVDLREVEFCSTSHKMARMQDQHVPLIIEDCAHTAVHCASAGLGAILIPHPYNLVTFPGVTRLKSSRQLATTVISFYKQLEDAGLLAPKLAS